MCYKGEICGHDYERQKDGTFIYKAKEEDLSAKQRIVRPEYKEKPQYPLIEQYEKKSVERYQEDIKSTVKEVVQYLNTI